MRRSLNVNQQRLVQGGGIQTNGDHMWHVSSFLYFGWVCGRRDCRQRMRCTMVTVVRMVAVATAPLLIRSMRERRRRIDSFGAIGICCSILLLLLPMCAATSMVMFSKQQPATGHKSSSRWRRWREQGR